MPMLDLCLVLFKDKTHLNHFLCLCHVLTLSRQMNLFQLSKLKMNIVSFAVQYLKEISEYPATKMNSLCFGFLLTTCNNVGRFLLCSSFFPCLSTEWRPGSTGQILSDLDLTSQKEGRWKRLNTLAHYNVSSVCKTCRLPLPKVIIIITPSSVCPTSLHRWTSQFPHLPQLTSSNSFSKSRIKEILTSRC